MAPHRLIVVDPGHFHAALVQKEMYPDIAPRVRVYAPLGPDLLDYLTRIARFNARPESPTCWEMDIQAGPDFLARLGREEPGGIAVLSGRNRGKLERIRAAVEAGLHVLADKPAIVRGEDLPALEEVLRLARERRRIVLDMMSGRYGAVPRLTQALHADPELFGEQIAGSEDDPGVAIASVHHLMKQVAGVANPRPPWYFDVAQQGEGLADVGTHLVDRAHETLFPGAALDWRGDIRLHAAERWPTPVAADQFREVTGEARWPDFLLPSVSGDRLDLFCNGRACYEVRGVTVRIEIEWRWQAEPGADDAHSACFRGSRARLETRQGAAERYRAELYVVPQADIAAALHRRVAALQTDFPGLGLEARGGEWRLLIPDALRIDHDTQFLRLTRRFLGYVADPASFPQREAANLLAKYRVTTEAVALSRR